jgi:hypothetical protein
MMQKSARTGTNRLGGSFSFDLCRFLGSWRVGFDRLHGRNEYSTQLMDKILRRFTNE